MIDSTIRCGYCKQYSNGNVFKSGDTIQRKCIARQIKVDFNHRTCKYFEPVKYFLCTKWNDRITFPICLNRRVNHEQLGKYLYCKRCRQFDHEIREMVSEYFIDGTKIRRYNPDKPLRKLARRSDPAKRKIKRRTPKKRVLKKRTKQPTKRKIKRRS